MIENCNTGQHRPDVTPSESESRMVQEICTLIARRIRKRSIIFTHENSLFAEVRKTCCHQVETRDIRLVRSEKERSFRSVVLMEVLQHLPDREKEDILHTSWNLLEEKGSLIVVVPNDNALASGCQTPSMNRRKLKKMLLPLGRPKIEKEQPFRWLMMYVRKRPPVEREVNRSILSRLRATVNLCSGKVLELGCGSGILTEEIHNQGLDVTGVDINTEKIGRARRRCPHIPFLQQDVLTLSLPSESFDTVILPEVLEHVPEEKGNKMLHIAWGLLKNRGRLIVSVPNENCIPHPNHVRQFDVRSLKSLLGRYGKPCTAVDQPYKWLMMYVEKKGEHTEGYRPPHPDLLQEDQLSPR